MTTDADRATELQRQGRLDEAAALYERLLQGPSFQPALRHNLGMLRLQQSRISEALPLLERAHAEDGRHPQWMQSLPVIGMRLYEHGLWESALTWLERSVALTPPDAAVAQTLARLRPRPHLAPEVWDELQQRSLLRYTPRESASYVYAIDVVGTCNLRCPTCPVGNFTAADRPKGFMEPELFERILDKIVAERMSEGAAAQPQIWLGRVREYWWRAAGGPPGTALLVKDFSYSEGDRGKGELFPRWTYADATWQLNPSGIGPLEGTLLVADHRPWPLPRANFELRLNGQPLANVERSGHGDGGARYSNRAADFTRSGRVA